MELELQILVVKRCQKYKKGNTEIEISIAGRDRMEREIANTYPDAEYMDTWVWFQSGINTDGAHNPKKIENLKKETFYH